MQIQCLNKTRCLCCIVKILFLFLILFSLTGWDSRWKKYADSYDNEIREFKLGPTAFSILSMAVSPDDRQVLLASMKNPIYLIDFKDGEILCKLRGHKGSTQSVDFSPSGTRVVSGGGDGCIRIWDLQKAREILSISAHESYVRAVKYSPDGKYILSGGDDDDLVLWNAENGHEIRRFKGQKYATRPNCLDFSPDGQKCISGAGDGIVRLWDINSGNELARLNPYQGPGCPRIMSVVFSPDGRHVLSSYLDLDSGQPVILWDLDSKTEVNRFGLKGNPWFSRQFLHIDCVDFSSDGRTALFGLALGTVIFWDVHAWKEIKHNHVHKKSLRFVQFSNHSNKSISLGSDDEFSNGLIRIWDLSAKR